MDIYHIFDAKLPKWDSWFDSSMALAKTIVEIFAKSKHFILTEWEGQDDFYTEYLGKFEQFGQI